MICGVDGPLWLTVAIHARSRAVVGSRGAAAVVVAGRTGLWLVSRRAMGRDGGGVQGLYTKIRGRRAGIAGGASN